MELNESQTRSLPINPQLLAAGWKLSDRTQVRFGVPVAGYDPTPWNGITDFCLYHPSGRVLSVVEAKRASRNPPKGEEQLRQYITEIELKQDFAPFGFMGNGLNTWFWEVGLAQDTARLATLDAVESRYLMCCLATEGMQHMMAGLTCGVAVQGINLGDVKELPIPVPPLPLQEKFAGLVGRVERLRSVQRESLRQADHLFISLLNRSFPTHI